MKKKIMLSLAAVAMVGTLAVGGTLAWFTDTETATNVVTTGNVDIQWFEGVGVDNFGVTAAKPGMNIEGNQVPGYNFEKNATVKNVGKNDAYIRAKISYQIGDGDLTTDIPTGYEVEVAGIDSRWQYDEETGYYYYLDKVTKETSTNALVNTVGISKDATDAIENQSFKIVLNAEAIQADNVTTEENANLEGLAYLKSVFGNTSASVADKTQNDQGGTK